MAREIKTEAVVICLNSVATVFVALRAVSRFSILKRPAVDDYLIIVAVCLSWILTALVIAQVDVGLGQHYTQISPENFRKLLKFMWSSILAYNVGLTVTKLSALFQIIRFCVTYNSRIAAWIIVIIVTTYGIAAPIASVCSCLPIAFFWDKSIKDGKCISLLPFWYFVAFFNIVTDIAVVGLPIFILKDLNLPKRQKTALIGIFAVGGVTCLVAIVRLESILTLTRSKDVSYDNAEAAMWSAAELNIAIVCACLPSLKPLAQKIAPKWLGNEDSNRRIDDTHASRPGRGQPLVKLDKSSLGSSSNDSGTTRSYEVHSTEENLQHENS